MGLAEAAAWMRAHHGVPTVRSTVWRWAVDGVDGVKLETVKYGRELRTSVGALQRFVDGRAAGEVGGDDGLAEARARLDAAGI